MGMLILTRRLGESVIFRVGGMRIEVKILGHKGNQVRVGMEAPQNVEINREEIDSRKHPEDYKSATTR